jgi:DNA repair protein RadC
LIPENRAISNSYVHPTIFRQSKDVYETMQAFAKSDREMFFIVFLNTRNRMLDYVVQTVGTFDSSAVYARDVIRSAIIHNACSIIICHNHPSGDPAPSAGDKEITKVLVAAFEIVGIRILDHVVLGNGRFFSFADAGLIEDYKVEAGDVLRRLNL